MPIPASSGSANRATATEQMYPNESLGVVKNHHIAERPVCYPGSKTPVQELNEQGNHWLPSTMVIQ
jgi:hypothetical protein